MGSEEELFQKMSDYDLLDYLTRLYNEGQFVYSIRETDPLFVEQLEVRNFLEGIINKDEQFDLSKVAGLQDKLARQPKEKIEIPKRKEHRRPFPMVYKKQRRNGEQVRQLLRQEVIKKYRGKSPYDIQQNDSKFANRLNNYGMVNSLVKEGILVRRARGRKSLS